MVNEHEFKKQFSNMGIDKDSVLGANKFSKSETKETKPVDENNEIMLLKRKMEYLQNNIVAKFNEKFEELEKKIDSKSTDTMSFNREMTQIKNDVVELKRKLKSVRVVFGEDPVETSTPKGEKKESTSSSANANPGNVKVEDYFNFSNKKFD